MCSSDYTPDTPLADVIDGNDVDTTRVAYSYDEIGRLKEVEVQKNNGNTLSTPKITTYSYDEVGNREQMKLPNDVNTDYQYDTQNRLTEVEHTLSGILSRYTYALAADGMRTGVSERQKHPGGTTEYHSITYDYDNLNRLTYESAQDPNTAEGYDITYEYDLVGNRTYRQINANGQTLQTQYSYNISDQLTKEVHTEPVAALPYGDDRVYAYASNNKISYKTAAGGTIGGLMAFFIGLPSEWSYYLFIAAMVLVPVAFFVPVLMSLRASSSGRARQSHNLSLFHRCLCVMFAYIMLIGPWSFQQLARASTLYSQISTSDWAGSNRTIDYQYDENGSVIEKKTSVTSTEEVLETITYDYNLQNRLERVTREYVQDSNDIDEVTEYTYDDDGIRVKSYYYETVNGGSKQNEETKTFLIDAYNHTGYAHVLEKWTEGVTYPATYTIGDDVIGEKPGGGPLYNHFLHDGHGSVRQLVRGNGDLVDTYSYDGYGVMLGGNPASISAPNGTHLLYAGQWFDTVSQHYYNRARWYDPLIGRFNRLDPFSGNTQDPQSLHKYLYCHANPTNNIDPSGKWNILTVVDNLLIRMMVMVQTTPVLMKAFIITSGILAIAHLYILATDPEAFDFFVASCGGDLTMVSGIIAMDIKAIGNLGRMIGSTFKNVITIKHLSGSLKSFRRKGALVQNAAKNGGLVYVGDTSSMRPKAKMAQRAYRQALEKRLTQWYRHKGLSEAQAAYKVKIQLRKMHVDHRIGLQVSGALENPNNIHNLGMLEDSVNASFGKQIQLECGRLGLQPGDFIDEVILIE